MGEIKCGLIAASRGVTVCDTCGVQSINIAVTLTFVLQVNEVFDSALGWTAYLVSNFDVIVVTVDGRGTGYRGERWVKGVLFWLRGGVGWGGVGKRAAGNTPQLNIFSTNNMYSIIYILRSS